VKRVINGFEMNFEDVGEGPALLLVHGFPFDHSMWTHQMEALQQDYRVIAPDLRGHGQSEVTPGPYSMDLLAEDLYALLQSLGIEQVVLVGLSMGGYIAFAFWRSYPELVQALVLADTRATADTPEGRQNRQEMIEQVRAEGTRPIADQMVARLLSALTLEKKPAVVSHARRMILNTPVDGVVGALQGMAQRPDSTPLLETITVPTLILVGEEDTVTPPQAAAEMQAGIQSPRRSDAPEVELVHIRQAGHLSPLENPEVFNLALREFLQKHAL
jgi:3-oxoadipate enol-lactonase